MSVRILLLYASYGDGHRQTVSALTTACREIEGIEVFSVDCFRGTSARWSHVTESLYEWLTRWVPRVYGLSYTWTKTLSVRHPLWRALSVFSRRAAWAALRERQPDVVLQLFPDHALAALPADIVKRPLVGVVLTDYALHSRWFHPQLDVVYVSPGALEPDVTRFLSDQQCVVESGVPIRSQFTSATFGQAPFTEPYVVIATGGRGLFRDLASVLETIRRVYPEYNVVILCGRNQNMLAWVNERTRQDRFVRGVGYVENVARWLYFAQFAVVKAGGVTIAECLAMQCPMLFYRPLPGQEAENAAYASREGTGMTCVHARALEKVLFAFSPENCAQMRICARRIARPTAASVILEDILARFVVSNYSTS